MIMCRHTETWEPYLLKPIIKKQHCNRLRKANFFINNIARNGNKRAVDKLLTLQNERTGQSKNHF